MHAAINLLSLNIRRQIALMKLMYQYSRELSSDNVLAKVEPVAAMRTRSQATVTLKCHFPRSKFFKRSISYQRPSP